MGARVHFDANAAEPGTSGRGKPAKRTAEPAHRSSGPATWMVAALLVGVAGMTLAAHWPVLCAEAMSLDDQQFLVDNHLVQNPSWASVRRFFGEVLSPSTVAGYYLPVSMTSLMLDYAMGGRPAHLLPFHRTSLLDLESALMHYYQAVQLEPGHPPARYKLGMALEQAGKAQAAREAYQQTLQLDSQHEQARQALERVGASPD